MAIRFLLKKEKPSVDKVICRSQNPTENGNMIFNLNKPSII